MITDYEKLELMDYQEVYFLGLSAADKKRLEPKVNALVEKIETIKEQIKENEKSLNQLRNRL